MKNIATAVFSLISLSSCAIHIHGNAIPVSNEQWTALLKRHVNEAGLVDYKGFIKDKAELQSFLDKLTSNPPAKDWSDNEKIAYWLNAYNAFTIKLIVDHYPVKSIKDLGPKHQIIFINTESKLPQQFCKFLCK